MHEQTTNARLPMAAIANSIVQITREYTGRGPTSARADIRNDLVTVLLHDSLLKAERKLADKGEGAIVIAMRRSYQSAMREDMVAAVEMLTQRRVVAFLSDQHTDPDIAIEAFVLEHDCEAA